MSEQAEDRYRAYCKEHSWEGMSQINHSDANKDLIAHKEQYPDESHQNSGIKSYKV